MVLSSIALGLEFMLEIVQKLCKTGYGRVLMGAIALPLPVRHGIECSDVCAEERRL
jgi:hypothetical protein